MKKLAGIPVSSGVACGKAFIYGDDDGAEIPRYPIEKEQVSSEWERFLAAVNQAKGEVADLHRQASQKMSREQADIFAAHLMMLEDVDFQDQIKARLASALQNIEWVVRELSMELTRKMFSSPDAYLRERAMDISDISNRLLNKLLSITKVSLADIDEDVILVARDLLPSDVMSMNKERVKAIATDMGSRTSHTAILARAFEIPAVLGLSTATAEIQDGDTLALDGDSGEVVINPGERVLGRYKRIIKESRRLNGQALSAPDLPAETLDGRRVSLKINIEVPEEAAQVHRYKAEGIGLYRSEFLFFTAGKAAGEEQQYQAYSQVVRAVQGLPVTIRTIDIGGDKLLTDFQTGDEKNPLLGWRAIRFSLSLPEIFKAQLRAILRSGAEGNVEILFPLISGAEELDQALAILEEAKAECRRQKKRIGKNIPVGVMIEVPSAVMVADILAGKSDFFSIGTNDLIQYSLAVDRGNEKVNYLARFSHPAVVRFLGRAIDAAHAKGIKASVCGEMAGDPQATALLLGLGLDEFSMTASSIPAVKRIIRGASMESCRSLADKALSSGSSAEVEALIQGWMSEYFPAG